MRLSHFCVAASVGLVAAMLSPVASAHGNVLAGEGAHAPIWLSQGLFVVAWLTYVIGAARRSPGLQRQLLFHGAMALTGFALFGPFDEWADSSTAMHMAQHMLLIVGVAPLAVMARPLPQWRACIGHAADVVWRPLLRISRHPSACALLHAAAIWIWHAPGPYMAAVADNWLHVAEHASFLLTGWLFWWSVLRAGRQDALAAALALLFTATHTGMLGALLTFAGQPLYIRESQDLRDQQLAGLIMWIPGGGIYLLAAAWAGYRWLSQAHAKVLSEGA